MSKNQIHALKQEQAALRRLTYKDDATTARLETIYRLLEKHAVGMPGYINL